MRDRCRSDRRKENALTAPSRSRFGGARPGEARVDQGEVSRSHSTDRETSCIDECGGLTGSGRAERQVCL